MSIKAKNNSKKDREETTRTNTRTKSSKRNLRTMVSKINNLEINIQENSLALIIEN